MSPRRRKEDRTMNRATKTKKHNPRFLCPTTSIPILHPFLPQSLCQSSLPHRPTFTYIPLHSRHFEDSFSDQLSRPSLKVWSGNSHHSFLSSIIRKGEVSSLPVELYTFTHHIHYTSSFLTTRLFWKKGIRPFGKPLQLRPAGKERTKKEIMFTKPHAFFHSFSRPRPTTSSSSSSSSKITFEPLPAPVASVVLQSWDDHASSWQGSSDALADWLNGRWAKTGVVVSKETICFTLRLAGRDAHMGLPDPLAGRFLRSGVEWVC